MLLTAGQISLAISSGIGNSASQNAPKISIHRTTTLTPTPVLIFTALLFLTGYVLQQQTLKSLQSAIIPNLPKAEDVVPKYADDLAGSQQRVGVRFREDADPGPASSDAFDAFDGWEGEGSVEVRTGEGEVDN